MMLLFRQLADTSTFKTSLSKIRVLLKRGLCVVPSVRGVRGGLMEYLFVYGTLRKDYQPKLIELSTEDVEYISEGKVKASLYDMGSYPAAIKEDEYDEVMGDVFLMKEAKRIFEILDEYERKEYKRVKEQVQLTSRKTIQAWIYFYNGKPEEKQKVNESDYLNYLKNKKSV